MLKDLKRPAGKQLAEKNPKLGNFEKQFESGSGSKKKVRVGSGSGYSSNPDQGSQKEESIDKFKMLIMQILKIRLYILVIN